MSLYDHKFLGSLAVTLIALSLALDAQTPAPASAIAKSKIHLDKAGEDEVGYAQAIKVGSTIYVRQRGRRQGHAHAITASLRKHR